MRVAIAAIGGVVAAGAAMGTRPARQSGSRISVGRSSSRAPEFAINHDDVTVVEEDGTRYFTDGALVGFWRALRAHRVLEVDADMVATVEPDWEGEFVAPADSAAAWAENESAKGRWVLGPVLLAFDTCAKRFLWSTDSAEPAVGDIFAVVLPPRSKNQIRELANQAEDGG